MAGISNEVFFGSNVDFTGGFPVVGQMVADGQLLIGATVAPNIRAGSLTSSNGTITITTGPGTIDLKTSASASETITGNTGGAVSPLAGNWSLFGNGAVSVAGTPGTGTLVITTNGFQSWIDQGASVTVQSNKNYFATAAATLLLPAVPNQGDTIRVFVDTAASVVVQANGGQYIRLSSTTSTAGGTYTNTARGDEVTLVYRALNSTWNCSSFVGSWTPA
jgi:hypothetical protein